MPTLRHSPIRDHRCQWPAPMSFSHVQYVPCLMSHMSHMSNVPCPVFRPTPPAPLRTCSPLPVLPDTTSRALEACVCVGGRGGAPQAARRTWTGPPPGAMATRPVITASAAAAAPCAVVLVHSNFLQILLSRRSLSCNNQMTVCAPCLLLPTVTGLRA